MLSGFERQALGALTRLGAALPEPHAMNVLDPHIGIFLIALHILALVPPPTRGWRLLRAALAPLIALTWLYLGYVPVLRTPHERWGSNLLFCESCFPSVWSGAVPGVPGLGMDSEVRFLC